MGRVGSKRSDTPLDRPRRVARSLSCTYHSRRQSVDRVLRGSRAIPSENASRRNPRHASGFSFGLERRGSYRETIRGNVSSGIGLETNIDSSTAFSGVEVSLCPFFRGEAMTLSADRRTRTSFYRPAGFTVSR